jgi:general secretion pathway protein G
MARLPAFLRDRKGRDYSLFELVVAGAIVLVVVGVLLDQVRYYQEQAERSAVRSTVALLQSALALRAMAVLVKGDPERIGRLERENPMEWLAQQPANYAGAFYGEPLERIPGGGWYFDRTAGRLVYQVWRGRHFEPAVADKPEIRFRVTAEYGEVEGSGRSAARGLKRLQIGPEKPYRWFDEG